MARGGSKARILVAGLVVLCAFGGAGLASGSVGDTGVLNQVQVSDPTGDSGSGPDLSSLAVTSYSDGTVSFNVGLANRTYLEAGESVQIFVDLNDDGTADLNLSMWPSFSPSYLARAVGSGWTNIRQLPELVQAPGSLSVRLSLVELRGDAAVPVAPTIQVWVGSWGGDAAGSGPAEDWLPDNNSVALSINGPTAATTTTTATTTTASNTTTTATTPAAATPLFMGGGFGFKLEGSGAARQASLNLRACTPTVPLRLVVHEHLKTGSDLGRVLSFTIDLTGGKPAGVFNGMACRSYSTAWKLAKALYGKGWIISTFQLIDAQGKRSGTTDWPLRAPAA